MTQYTRGFGDAGQRMINVTTSDDGIMTTLDQNVYGDGEGCLLKYAYTAPVSGELTLTFEAVNSNDTWHHYAFSNEVAVPVYLDPTPLPAGQISSNDTLSWDLTGVAAKPTYHLKLATDPGMSNLVVDIDNLTVTTFDPALNPEADYYWQVEVIEQDGVINTSPVWAFRTLPAPPDAVKLFEWKFDETQGIVAQQTGLESGGQGILNGFNNPDSSQVHVVGLVSNSLLLNGMDEYVDVSSAHTAMPVGDGQSFSVSGYICTFGDYGPVFSMRNSADETPIIDITIGADGVQNAPGKLCVLVRDNAGSMSNMNSGIAINDGRWHNIILTRHNDDWVLYIDGNLSATMPDVATGSLTLDWMGIGASIKWIADNWQSSNNHYRYFKGLVDEFTVWQGVLQPHQMSELTSILPPDGDLNADSKINLQDFADFAGEWSRVFFIPVQPTTILEDMESYASAPGLFDDYWNDPAESGYGETDLSVASDLDGVYGKVLRWDYDFNGNSYVKSTFRLFERRTDLTLFDRLRIRVKKLNAGAGDTLIVDVYDGRSNLDPETEGMHYKGRTEFDLSALVENQWVVLEADLPGDFYDGFPTTCHDLYEFTFFIGENDRSGEGTLLIDSVVVTDDSVNCVPIVGENLSDINADCSVNMQDLIEIANRWMWGV